MNRKRIIIDLCTSSSSSADEAGSSSNSDAEDDGWDALMELVLSPPVLSPDLPVPAPVPAATFVNNINNINNESNALNDPMDVDVPATKKRLLSVAEDALPPAAKRAKAQQDVPAPISPVAAVPVLLDPKQPEQQEVVEPLEERLCSDAIGVIVSFLNDDTTARGRLKQTCKYLNALINDLPDEGLLKLHSMSSTVVIIPHDLVTNAGVEDREGWINDSDLFKFMAATGFLLPSEVDTLFAATAITTTMEPEDRGARLMQRYAVVDRFLAQERRFTCLPVDRSRYLAPSSSSSSLT